MSDLTFRRLSAVNAATRFIADERLRLPLAEALGGSILGGAAASLAGRSVLVATAGQLPAVLAMLELDGLARRILLCPPDLDHSHLDSIVADGEVEAVVTDAEAAIRVPGLPTIECAPVPAQAPECAGTGKTEWVLFTSGTTGRPKLAVHTLASLVGPVSDKPVADGAVSARQPTWSTFYDVRRYGGMAILMRALAGHGSMVLSRAGEATAAFLARAGAAGVTHISGTPSHWRLALMADVAAFSPDYVRLSGEIADQALLDRLARAFPDGSVAHAFATTEAGFAFDVRDGRAGFPAGLVDEVRLRVHDGTLRVSGPRTARRLLGPGARPLKDADGFVDTGDVVARVGERFHFLGRREGVINVGGRKVYPEEVEAVIARQPGVEMCRVWSRPSPITGAIVAADLVLSAGAVPAAIREAVAAACRAALDAHKVPVAFRIVDDLAVAASGKIARRNA